MVTLVIRRWVRNPFGVPGLVADSRDSCALLFKLGAVASALIYVALAGASTRVSMRLRHIDKKHDFSWTMSVFAAVRTWAIWNQNKKIFYFVLCTGLIYPALALVSKSRILRWYDHVLISCHSRLRSSFISRWWTTVHHIQLVGALTLSPCRLRETHRPVLSLLCTCSTEIRSKCCILTSFMLCIAVRHLFVMAMRRFWTFSSNK